MYTVLLRPVGKPWCRVGNQRGTDTWSSAELLLITCFSILATVCVRVHVSPVGL